MHGNHSLFVTGPTQGVAHFPKCPSTYISSCHNSHSGANWQVLTDGKVVRCDLKQRVIVTDVNYLDINDNVGSIFCVIDGDCQAIVPGSGVVRASLGGGM